MKNKETIKSNLNNFIEDFENKGYDEFECLCSYCHKCYDKDTKPDDCKPDCNDENCIDAFKELIFMNL